MCCGTALSMSTHRWLMMTFCAASGDAHRPRPQPARRGGAVEREGAGTSPRSLTAVRLLLLML